MIEEESLPELDQEEELFEHHRFKADKGQDFTRIDKFLLDRLPNTSRNKIQVAAKNGNIHVGGNAVKQNYKVKPGDEISIVMPYPVREITLIPQDIPIDIQYEDEQLIIVNKFSNMVVHPGYGNYKDTLVNALVFHFERLPSMSSDYYGRPGLVHRIDKHTTGLLVIAKTESALSFLAKQFFDRTIERRYFALVWGDLQNNGTITGNIGRSLKNRKVMTVYPEGDHGKHAVTHYEVVERFGFVTLVSCKLETGRTHQIRAHFQHIGHSLFNDNEYGGTSIIYGRITSSYKSFVENCFQLLDGQALHAYRLGFVHPTKEEFVCHEVEMPANFQTLIERWRNFCKGFKIY
ncbi:MAG TPA: RNA pseudouridine synthase [Crocinitomicaceae bacterium]|nr:RluA family pseudouridine synthase [Flavobacteriales bacterium]HBW86853.1 RNA pseudouridine synthase [Crocinitomicaceae bacterium]